jgi:hypothetical protein
MNVLDEPADICEVVAQDCSYGFRAFCVMSDGTTAFHTAGLHATAAQAVAETAARARAGGVA